MTAPLKSSLISQERFQEMAFSGNGPVEEWIGAMREVVGDGMVICGRTIFVTDRYVRQT